MNQASIPASLSEFGNGLLLAMFIICDVFFALYVGRTVSASLRDFEGDFIKDWRQFYSYENKAAIAWLTMSIGMTMKQIAAWWSLHLHTHGYQPNFPVLTPLFLGGTFIAVWGLVCLLRALSRYDWPMWIWLSFMLASIAFATAFAL